MACVCMHVCVGMKRLSLASNSLICVQHCGGMGIVVVCHCRHGPIMRARLSFHTMHIMRARPSSYTMHNEGATLILCNEDLGNGILVIHEALCHSVAST
jgi:hypothetical protein